MLCTQAATVWAEPIVFTDDLGRNVQLEAPAKRIIALYGAFNEILAAMGLEDRIVGRTKADLLPPSIVDKPSIGTHMRPNVELVVGLRPDLVLQMGGRKDASLPVEQLQELGLTTAFFNVTDFPSLMRVITILGEATGQPDAASRLVDSMQHRLDAVKTRIPNGTRPSVFFEVRENTLLAAGTTSMVNAIIDAAGGQNAVTVNKKLVRTSEEELLRLDPDVYLYQEGAMNQSPTPPTDRPRYGGLHAVQSNRTYRVDEQEFSRPGPRNIDAVERLATWLYPETSSAETAQ